MNSRERMFCTLSHREPDRIPYDLASTHVTSIHVAAYRNLCRYLDIDPEPVVFSDILQQVVTPRDALLERLGVDTRGLFPWVSHNTGFEHVEDKGDAFEHVDEWGFTQRMQKDHGHWWSQVGFPLDGMSVDPEALAGYAWPEAADPRRLDGLRQVAEEYHRQDKIVVCKSLCAGLFEMGQRIRGMSNFLCDLLADPQTAETILDRILDLKKQFWAMVIDEIGDLVDIVAENDDYGTQQSQLISYDTYKTLISPRLRELVRFVKERHARKRSAEEPGYFFLHSCGNIRPYLPDFIDMGVDILNPVHITAADMGPEQLKKDFGDDIVFWGGGVETQNILPTATPDEIRQNVRRNVEALMPGGGFVFNTVHNIQAEVPPENIVAMWEALQEYGQYSYVM
jgi:uroporphyrinogen decarboxylase